MPSMPPPRPRRRFLGWDTVVGGASVQFLQTALVYQSFGVYLVAWGAELGWSRSAASAGYAMITIAAATLGLVQGRLMERFGVRAMVRFGLAGTALGLVALSTVADLRTFYAAMGLLGVGMACAGYLPLTAVIVPWFRTRRATALALMQLGISAAGLAVPFVAGTIEEHGWRTVARASAGVFLIAAVPLGVLMRRAPEAYGQRPDGAPRSTVGARLRTRAAPILDDDRDAFTVRAALRTRSFWTLSIAQAGAMLVVNAVSVHLVAHVVDGTGTSLARAAALVTVVTVASGIGHLLGGPLGDRFAKRAVVAAAMLAHAAALVGFLVATTFPWIVACAALHGAAWGVRSPIATSMLADYFGTRRFASIMGASMAVFLVGQLVGPIAAGWVADATGSYRGAFTGLAVVALLSAVGFGSARPPLPPTPFGTDATFAATPGRDGGERR
jgi:MFS family permease